MKPSFEYKEFLAELRRTGVTVLRSVIPADVITTISVAVDRERERLEQTNRAALYKINMSLLASPGHPGFLCPLNYPFCHEEIITAPRLSGVLAAYLGSDFYLHEYVVNISLARGTTAQHVHLDQENDGLGTVGVVCNFPLSFTGPHNGMTKMWLGSQDSPERDLETLNNLYTPFQPTLYPGDVMIRDLGLLHQGTPNPDIKDRNLLALVYKPERQKLGDEVRGDIPQSVWNSWNARQQAVMRRHQRVEANEVYAQPYSVPDAM